VLLFDRTLADCVAAVKAYYPDANGVMVQAHMVTGIQDGNVVNVTDDPGGLKGTCWAYENAVAIRDIPNMNCTFTHLPNHALSGHNTKRIDSQTVAQCMHACCNEHTFDCLSFDFTKANGRCDLSDTTRAEHSGDWLSKTEYDHYEMVTRVSAFDPTDGDVANLDVSNESFHCILPTAAPTVYPTAAPTNHDCQRGRGGKRWGDAKRAYCCAHEGLGCDGGLKIPGACDQESYPRCERCFEFNHTMCPEDDPCCCNCCGCEHDNPGEYCCTGNWWGGEDEGEGGISIAGAVLGISVLCCGAYVYIYALRWAVGAPRRSKNQVGTCGTQWDVPPGDGQGHHAAQQAAAQAAAQEGAAVVASPAPAPAPRSPAVVAQAAPSPRLFGSPAAPTAAAAAVTAPPPPLPLLAGARASPCWAARARPLRRARKSGSPAAGVSIWARCFGCGAGRGK